MGKSHVPYKSFYRLTEAFRHISTHDTTEALDDQVIELQFLGAVGQELGFLMWQAENNTTCFPKEAKMRTALDLIFKKVILATDLAGTIKRVLNKPDIAREWGLLRDKFSGNDPRYGALRSRFDWIFDHPTGLEQFLADTKYALLLPGFADDTPADTHVAGEQQAAYFLDEHSVPLITTTCFSACPEQAHAHQLAVVGVLNAEQFDQKSFAKWLKKKVDIYDLKVAVTADFEQKQLFDPYGVALVTGQRITVRASGVAGR